MVSFLKFAGIELCIFRLNFPVHLTSHNVVDILQFHFHFLFYCEAYDQFIEK